MNEPPRHPLSDVADDLAAAPADAAASPSLRSSDLLQERLEEGDSGGLAGRVAAFAGAGLLLGAATRRRSTATLAAAAAAALPLAYRGVTGRWPLPRRLTAGSVVVKTRLVVWRPRREVYEAWRALDRLPAILRHVERVEALGERRSRWSVHVPGGLRVEWDAEITEDRPGEVLAWRSLDGSPVQQLGSLHFDPAGRPGRPDGATLLRVDLRLLPPGGAAGAAATALLQPLLEREIHEDLRRFKSVLEAGEAPTTEGQPHGERGLLDVHNPL